MADKPDIWMPLFIRDYLGDTQHLTDAQHGHYLLAIMAYWMRGSPLPDNEDEVCRICRMDTAAYAPDMRSHHFQVLRRFFTPKDGFLIHNRVEHELENARGKSAAAKKAAEERWRKSNNNADAPSAHMRNGMRNGCPSPSPSPSPLNINNPPNAREHPKLSASIPPPIDALYAHGQRIMVNQAECDKFYGHYEAQGWVLGNGQAMANWQQALVNWKNKKPEMEGRKNGRGEPPKDISATVDAMFAERRKRGLHD